MCQAQVQTWKTTPVSTGLSPKPASYWMKASVHTTSGHPDPGHEPDKHWLGRHGRPNWKCMGNGQEALTWRKSSCQP